MRRLLSLLSLSTVLFAAAAAHADTYVLTFTDQTTGQVGTLSLKGTVAPAPAANTIDISGLASGAFGGNGVSLTIPGSYDSNHQFFEGVYGNYGSDGVTPDPSSFYNLTLDNLLITVPTGNTHYITYNGVWFTDGTFYYNLYDNQLGVYDSNSVGQYTHTVTYDSLDVIAATPEPSSMMLMGTGMLAVVGGTFRRRFSR